MKKRRRAGVQARLRPGGSKGGAEPWRHLDSTVSQNSSVHYRCPRGRKFWLAVAAVISAGLHGLLGFGERWWGGTSPVPVHTIEAVQLIEIAMPPPPEPEVEDAVETLGDASEKAGVAPPQLADAPSAKVSAFTQPLAPPAPAGLAVGKGLSSIPVGSVGSGLGKGMGTIFDVKNLDQAPVLKVAVPPDFPYEMRRQAKAGMVDVEYVIDAEGVVVLVRVLGSTHEAFEQPAINAVRKWKYRPGKKGGRAVNTRVQQTIRFNLEPE